MLPQSSFHTLPMGIARDTLTASFQNMYTWKNFFPCLQFSPVWQRGTTERQSHTFWHRVHTRKGLQHLLHRKKPLINRTREGGRGGKKPSVAAAKPARTQSKSKKKWLLTSRSGWQDGNWYWRDTLTASFQNMYTWKNFLPCLQFSLPARVPAGSPSRGGDVKVYVLDINQPSLPTPFTLFSCLFLSYGPFTYISFHKFSRQLSVFSLCSPSLISASLVLSTIYIYLSKSLLKWFRRPGAFAVRCDPCRGRKRSWRLRCPLAAAYWGQHISLARTSLRRVVGLARPNQSAGRA